MTDSKTAARKWGPVTAQRLLQRLDDLRASENLEIATTLPGRLHPLVGDLSGLFSMDLEHPLRLIFEPADDSPQVHPDGGIDRSRVKAIRILAVRDTHD